MNISFKFIMTYRKNRAEEAPIAGRTSIGIREETLAKMSNASQHTG